jgi:hypothetical protein
VRCVFTPRPDGELVAQGPFVNVLSPSYGTTMLRNAGSGHWPLDHTPELIISHNPDHPTAHQPKRLSDPTGTRPASADACLFVHYPAATIPISSKRR